MVPVSSGARCVRPSVSEQGMSANVFHEATKWPLVTKRDYFFSGHARPIDLSGKQVSEEIVEILFSNVSYAALCSRRCAVGVAWSGSA